MHQTKYKRTEGTFSTLNISGRLMLKTLTSRGDFISHISLPSVDILLGKEVLRNPAGHSKLKKKTEKLTLKNT